MANGGLFDEQAELREPREALLNNNCHYVSFPEVPQ